MLCGSTGDSNPQKGLDEGQIKLGYDNILFLDDSKKCKVLKFKERPNIKMDRVVKYD